MGERASQNEGAIWFHKLSSIAESVEHSISKRNELGHKLEGSNLSLGTGERKWCSQFFHKKYHKHRGGKMIKLKKARKT